MSEKESKLYNYLAIDDREPPFIAEKVANFCSIPIQIERLDEGDYISGDVIVQRKEISDFAMSILDKRLFGSDEKEGQIQRMTSKHRKCYLLIHGYLEQSTVKIHPHCVSGAIAKICAVYNVNVLWVNDEDNMVYTLLKLFEWEGKLQVLKPKKHKVPREENQNV